jgi:HPt (histidine-containing phosphotransfer) domain-containing protein
MDDYIAKPVDRHRLATLLDRWQARLAADRHGRQPRASEASTPSPADAKPELALVDEEAQTDLRDALGEDSFDSLVAGFRHGIPARLREIESAMGRGDGNAVAAVAHSLRGAALNLGFSRMAAAASQLEAAAKGGDGALAPLVEGLASVMDATVKHTAKREGAPC